MPTRKQPRIPASERAAINHKVKGAAEVIAENIAGRKHGRPPRYHPGFDHIAEQCCILNADSPALADMFGAGVDAVCEWQQSYPHFAAAITRGKARTDSAVEQSLVRAAQGFSLKETVVMTVGDGGGRSHIETREITKNFPPDTRAGQFWLKNRKPKEYRPDAQLQPLAATDPDTGRQLRAQLAAMDAQTAPTER